MFQRAIQKDATITEASLVFLRRVLLIVSFTVIAVIGVTITSQDTLLGALRLQSSLHSEGNRAQLHTVCNIHVA